MGATVSVIFPIYGTFDERRLEIAIESVKRQKSVNPEIIVSEQNSQPRLNDSSIRHIFTPSVGNHQYNPGLIRNIALKNAKGNYVYTNDSDVVFLDEHFLANLVELSKENDGLSFYRPPMRRLPIEDFEDMYNLVMHEGLDTALGRLDKSKPYFASLSEREYDVVSIEKVCSHYTKTFTAFRDEYEAYKNNPELKGHEPKIFSENRHCGGNFALRDRLFSVGGYSQAYLNWGREDGDIQWKLRETSGLELVANSEEFEVLHLDHPKGYISIEMWKQNERTFKQRQAQGANSCVIHDKGVFDEI